MGRCHHSICAEAPEDPPELGPISCNLLFLKHSISSTGSSSFRCAFAVCGNVRLRSEQIIENRTEIDHKITRVKSLGKEQELTAVEQNALQEEYRTALDIFLENQKQDFEARNVRESAEGRLFVLDLCEITSIFCGVPAVMSANDPQEFSHRQDVFLVHWHTEF